MKIFNKKIVDILNFIKNIFFPPRCVFCDRIMEPNTEARVCGECSPEIDFCAAHTCCTKCGKPIISFGEKQKCYFCLENKTQYFNRIASVFVYDKIVRESILRYKFSAIQGYADTYAECLATLYSSEFSELDIDFICAVPSHSNKKVEYGFDQVEMICKRLENIIELDFKKNVLKKVRKTRRQSRLGFKERRENLLGSIAVARPNDVLGKTILLIDDICTTRATITECSRVLKQAGAKKVFALTLATTVKNNLNMQI